MSACTCLTLPNITLLTAGCPVHDLKKCVICACVISRKRGETPKRFVKRVTCGTRACVGELNARKGKMLFQPKACPYCKEIIPRRQHPDRLESIYNYNKRITCGASKCVAAHMKMTQEEVWAKRRPPPKAPTCPYCGDKIQSRPRYSHQPGIIYLKTCGKPDCLREGYKRGGRESCKRAKLRKTPVISKPKEIPVILKPKETPVIPRSVRIPALERFLQRYGTIPYEAVKVYGQEAFNYWQQCLEG